MLHGAKHKCPTAQVTIEIANKEGNTVKRELKVGVVLTLAMFCDCNCVSAIMKKGVSNCLGKG